MTDPRWTEIDAYLEQNLVPTDPVLEACRHASREAGLPDIEVSPTQGKLLYLLAQMQMAREVLEIGTLGGYSAIWLCRALPPDGHLTSLEINPKHAEVASANLERAGLRSRVEIRLGPALESLSQLVAEKRGPFDLFFLDADKENTRPYFEWALRLSRPGSLIVVDNVIRHGTLVEAARPPPDVRGMREFLEALRSDPRVSATAIQTVGRKGYDGFALVRVNEMRPDPRRVP
jgi:predicted O-methyltransferase YrrM